MRRGLDDWASYVAAIDVMLNLEKDLGCEFKNEEFDGVKTLRDVVGVVEVRLSSNRRAALQAVDLVTAAARQVQQGGAFFRHLYSESDCDGVLNFDVPLVDVFDPNRWDRRSGLTRS
jgi:hypothetical protein